MPPYYPSRRILACLLVLPLVAACERSPQAIAPEKIPEVLNQAFKEATGDARAAATQVVVACQSQDAAAIFTNLQELSHQPGLTPEQRSVAARAMVAAMPKLQAAAAAGNPSAQEALHDYLSTR